MSDQPNSHTTKEELKAKVLDAVAGKGKMPEGTKTFDFASEDQDFLQPRQILINQYRLAVTDVDAAVQSYIIQVVLPRLSVDPNKYAISYNVSSNKLTCVPKPPEILVPPKDIVIPGKPKQ